MYRTVVAETSPYNVRRSRHYIPLQKHKSTRGEILVCLSNAQKREKNAQFVESYPLKLFLLRSEFIARVMKNSRKLFITECIQSASVRVTIIMGLFLFSSQYIDFCDVV